MVDYVDIITFFISWFLSCIWLALDIVVILRSNVVFACKISYVFSLKDDLRIDGYYLLIYLFAFDENVYLQYSKVAIYYTETLNGFHV